MPSAEADADRHRSRERTTVIQERTRLRNQIGSWLATCGCRVSPTRSRGGPWWTRARDWADAPLPAPVQARIARAEARLTLLAEQLAAIEGAQAAMMRAAAPASARQRLVNVKGVATTSAAVLLDEGLEWRAFRTAGKSAGCSGSRRPGMTVGKRRATKGSVGPAIGDCNR